VNINKGELSRMDKSHRASKPLVISKNTFYVVLHGLVCLVDLGKPNGFRAYLHEMAAEHSYLCGDFFAEVELKAKQDGYPLYLDLKGIKSPGPKTLDPNQNAIIKLATAPTVKTGDVRAVIDLPRPNDISYFISGKLDPRSLQGDESSLVQVPQLVSGVRVFEYNFASYDTFRQIRVRGENHYIMWECPEPTLIKDTNVAVLHVYNEPPDELPGSQAAEHNVREFNRSLDFLGAKLQLTSAASSTPPNSSPFGLLVQEVSSLDTRQRFANIAMPWLRELWTLQPHLVDKKADLIDVLLKQLAAGGGGGSQVCGGANGQVFP
jgi:hypothetical protein